MDEKIILTGIVSFTCKEKMKRVGMRLFKVEILFERLGVIFILRGFLEWFIGWGCFGYGKVSLLFMWNVFAVLRLIFR